MSLEGTIFTLLVKNIVLTKLSLFPAKLCSGVFVVMGFGSLVLKSVDCVICLLKTVFVNAYKNKNKQRLHFLELSKCFKNFVSKPFHISFQSEPRLEPGKVEANWKPIR